NDSGGLFPPAARAHWMSRAGPMTNPPVSPLRKGGTFRNGPRRPLFLDGPPCSAGPLARRPPWLGGPLGSGPPPSPRPPPPHGGVDQCPASPLGGWGTEACPSHPDETKNDGTPSSRIDPEAAGKPEPANEATHSRATVGPWTIGLRAVIPSHPDPGKELSHDP